MNAIEAFKNRTSKGKNSESLGPMLWLACSLLVLYITTLLEVLKMAGYS
jgi:hypothetical protein